MAAIYCNRLRPSAAISCGHQLTSVAAISRNLLRAGIANSCEQLQTVARRRCNRLQSVAPSVGAKRTQQHTHTQDTETREDKTEQDNTTTRTRHLTPIVFFGWRVGYATRRPSLLSLRLHQVRVALNPGHTGKDFLPHLTGNHSVKLRCQNRDVPNDVIEQGSTAVHVLARLCHLLGGLAKQEFRRLGVGEAPLPFPMSILLHLVTQADINSIARGQGDAAKRGVRGSTQPS